MRGLISGNEPANHHVVLGFHKASARNIGQPGRNPRGQIVHFHHADAGRVAAPRMTAV